MDRRRGVPSALTSRPSYDVLMERAKAPPELTDVTRALLVLGGRGTLGDIVLATGLPCDDAQRALEALMAREQVHVTVAESAVVTYRLEERRRAVRTVVDRWNPIGRISSSIPPFREFDRKTLRLIRGRGGVISIAEFVEHTGLSTQKAGKDLRRLARLYGGEAHTSLDEHTVYAFPELVVSAHGRFSVREPRPAWVRARDPMRSMAKRGRRPTVRLALAAGGFVGSVAALGFVVLIPGSVGPGVTALLSGRALFRSIRSAPRFRFDDQATLRRYALGYVFETALKGKGVVSLNRTQAYLQARAGSRPVRRATVERALRQLADEFDAPITELNGDLFFGFRNVKRQFLASHLERARLHLDRHPSGRTLYDSGDSPLDASERELDSFDRALRDGSYGSSKPSP